MSAERGIEGGVARARRGTRGRARLSERRQPAAARALRWLPREKARCIRNEEHARQRQAQAVSEAQLTGEAIGACRRTIPLKSPTRRRRFGRDARIPYDSAYEKNHDPQDHRRNNSEVSRGLSG